MSGPSDSHGDDHADESLLYHAYDPDLTGEVTAMPAVRLDRRGLVGVIQSTQAAINRLLGLQYEAVAAFARTAAGDRSVVGRELALALAIGPRAAENQIELAQALVSRLPETLKAMRRGEIDAYKAGKIHEPTAMLDDEQAREVDAIMAARIGRKDPTSLRRSAGLAVATVDPDGYARRCERRRARRLVELIPQGEGMVKLCADLPIEVGAAAYARIDAEARRRRSHDLSKTLDRHRADILAELLLKDKTGLTVGPKAEVLIYLDFYTWLNLNTKPADMAGQGIIPGWLATEIASGENTTLRRLITDPDDGQILSVGRRRYRPPAALARLARTRDRECRSPICHRPAHACELDHVRDWQAKNGDTSADNLATFCTKDHHLKDHPGWTYTMNTHTGHITITTPTHHHYISTPPPLHEPRTNPLPDDPPY